MFHDDCAHIEKVSLIFDRDERSLCSIIFRDLKRLGQGSQRFNVSLNAHVPEHEQCRADGRLGTVG